MNKDLSSESEVKTHESNKAADMSESGGAKEANASELNEHFGNKSHTGLSALLSAVTLQLSNSNDEEKDCMNASEGHFDETDSEEGCKRQSPDTTTPTIVPEAQSRKNFFPSILMTLVMDPNNADIITFLPDGKYFALRSDAFETTLMQEAFKTCDDFKSFASQLETWGFRLIETKRPGIEVYRHRLFRKGDFKRCEKMKQNDVESRDVPVVPTVAVSSRTSSMSEDDPTIDRSGSEGTKRRLSPSSASKIPGGSSSKLRTNDSGEEESLSPTTNGDTAQAHMVVPEADFRRLAVSITTEKLNIQEEDDRELSLTHQAVEGATHTIVSGAIEALLRDENHTRQTFDKHKDELSKSSIPGLVPISKQLFSVGEEKGPERDAVADEDTSLRDKSEGNSQQFEQPSNPRRRTRTLSLENAGPDESSAASGLLQVANSTVASS